MKTRDWSESRERWEVLLEKQTGETLEAWNRRIHKRRFVDEEQLRAWLHEQGVSGYAQSLLVMETFGYPDFFSQTADELIEAQYKDRAQLRPIFEKIVDICSTFGDINVQARKTYVSLVGLRRTFVRIQPTEQYVDVALRLDAKPQGRLMPSKVHPSMPVQVRVHKVEEIDNVVRGLLEKAYDHNA